MVYIPCVGVQFTLLPIYEDTYQELVGRWPSTNKVADRLRKQTEKARNESALKYKIFHGKFYTVGPMDFCGIARIVRAQGGGRPVYVSLIFSIHVNTSC